MKNISVALIGDGFMGKVHAENLRRLGNVEIAAVAASSDEKARGLEPASASIVRRATIGRCLAIRPFTRSMS